MVELLAGIVRVVLVRTATRASHPGGGLGGFAVGASAGALFLDVSVGALVDGYVDPGAAFAAAGDAADGGRPPGVTA
jgi:hypothetical protein